MKVAFFPNGGTIVFDDNGQQMPKLQTPYILMFADILAQNKIDPVDCEFILPDGRQARVFWTGEGWNWEVV
jgi:hypothetical protein